MAEQFCLKWTDFHSSIVSALDSLKCSEDLVDVTLTCEGQNLKAHKVILSACSPYFRGVFKENPCQHPIIILKDVLAGDMTRLLAYMYQGEVTVQEDQLPALLQTAQLLQVSGLTSQILSPQNKMNAQKMISSTISKKAASHVISPVKKLTLHTSPSKDLLMGSSLKIALQHKKRRNSASERSAECPFSDQVKKCKIAKEKSSAITSKKTESTSTISEIVKTDSKEKEKNSSIHVEPISQGNSEVPVQQSSEDSQLISQVKVKHEILDEDDQGTEVGDEQVDESSSPQQPFYETSMLARSLISGTQSLKPDGSSGTSTMVKPKTGVPPVVETLPIEVKGERLSPGGDGLEPEVLISEEEARGGGGPPANHAAICGDCPHCGTQYSNQSALKYHVRLMHSDLTNRLCCYLCPRSFTVRDTFKEHMWAFHGQRN